MAEWWRALALTVPATLMQVSASEEALRLINIALWKLARQAEVVRRVRLGYLTAMDIDLPDPLPDGVCPTEILGDALRELTRLRALLAGAYAAFVLYAKQAGIVQPEQATDPLFLSWDRSRVDALLHANQGLRRLRAALSHAEAFKDALTVAGAAGRDEWMLAANLLAGVAMWEAHGALLEVHQMLHVVAMGHRDACMVLNRL